MFPVKPVAVLSFASSAVTCTDGVIPAPATALVGWTVKASFAAGPTLTTTAAVCVTPTPLIVAVTVFDSATVELKLPVATPLAFVVVPGCVSVLPVPVAASTTVAPAMGLSSASRAVTVIVDALAPVEAVIGDVAATLDRAPETLLAITTTVAVCVTATALMVADTVFDSATGELSVPVVTPSAPVGPPGCVSVLPRPVADSTTVAPGIGLPNPSITVTARDGFGNPIPGATVVLSATGLGNTLTQPGGPTGADGVTTGTLSSPVAESKTVSATINAVAVTQTATVVVIASNVSGARSSVAATSPITASTGASASTITVTARDALDNPIAGATVLLAATGTGNTLTQPGTTTNASGVATGSLSSTVAESKTVTATINGVGVTQTAAVVVNVGPAAKLAFTVQPTSAVAGAGITPSVQVTALDANDNTATGFTGNITVAIGTNPGGGALTGTATVAATAGVASFANLSINKVGTGYTLMASSGSLTVGTSAAFNITPGSATALVFSAQPTNAVAGAAITPAVQVTAQDGNGNTATGFTGTVTVAIGINPSGGTLAGTTTVSAVAGVATFPGLSIDKVGTGYTLSATGAGSTTSAAFNITAGTATALVFSVEPTNTVAGAAITPAVQITAQDGNGNTATGFTGNVTVAIGTNPSTGTLSGTKTVAAVAGVATFPGLSIDKVWTGYTLSATGAGSTTSAAFNVTAGTATALVFSVEPTNAVAGAAITPAVQVTAQDGNGNTATGFTGTVTVAIGT